MNNHELSLPQASLNAIGRMIFMAALKTLHLGTHGPQTELLQLALSRAGINPGNIDGIFGNKTNTAVRIFQTKNNLVADGIVGPATWKALRPYLMGYTTHIIRAGDTLYKLAQLYGTTIRAITTANPSIDPLSLTVGSMITIPLGFEVVPTNISFTSTVLEFSILGLKARYPFIHTDNFGQSVMGKPIYYLNIGSGGNEVFYNGTHHANEWIVSMLLMKYLENYSYAYASGGKINGADARSLFETTTLYIMPMVNPDGADLVMEELTNGFYYNRAKQYASDYPDIAFPSGWKANINGVDPNLQYPAGWEEAKKIKFAEGFTTPAPRDYVGSFPLEAPESRAVYDFTLTQDFSLSLSYHTQGGEIYWKYLNYEPENALAIAQRFAAVSGYSVADVPYASGFAGYKDWFILNYNRPGYTIEAGYGQSPLPLSQFDQIYRDNSGILTLGLSVTA